MKDYSTIKEKTVEWNISARHIQFLCRTGKIESAIKRAGVWFIPDNAPIPTKYTKSNIKNYEFAGTKNKVFNSAIELFITKGFDNVSFKDIAKSTGVRQSALYNHFRTKQELLDTIYDFYCHYYIKERLSLRDMELVIQKGSIMDIINCIRYVFKDDYRKKLTDITKIIFQRTDFDERSREIAKTLMIDEGIKYVETVFNRAVEDGRFAPFDTHMMAVFINIVRLFTLYYWIIDVSAENRLKVLEDEQALYKYAAGFLIDLNPPIQIE